MTYREQPQLNLSNVSTPTLSRTSSSLGDSLLLQRTHHLPIELQNFCVIGGGTGCNAVLEAFSDSAFASFIIPISDDGGSSSEIQRVLGGPSVGDIRSRLIRLIPNSPPHSPLTAIRTLLEHRLSDKLSSTQVKAEWHSIVEGRHRLWRGIPNDRKECLRAFLVHFESAVLKKAQRGFNWKRASIGNMFLTGAWLFLGSLPSAIFLFASITEIPHDTFRVVPVINTASTAPIAAELYDGSIIPGQSEISHPSISASQQSSAGLYPCPTPALPPTIFTSDTPAANGGGLHLPVPPPSPLYVSRAPTPLSFFDIPVLGDEEDDSGRHRWHQPHRGSRDQHQSRENASGPDSEDENEYDLEKEMEEAELRRNKNVIFSKGGPLDGHPYSVPPLPSRINRIFYLNAYGMEIFPKANPLFFESLSCANCLIYSCGSLYTSILPCLTLQGVGSSIALSKTLKTKILLLNSTLDRETPNYTATDFVEAITSALNRSYVGPYASYSSATSSSSRESRPHMETGAEESQSTANNTRLPRLREAKEYITHIIYLKGGQVEIDIPELEKLGIVCVEASPRANRASAPLSSSSQSNYADNVEVPSTVPFDYHHGEKEIHSQDEKHVEFDETILKDSLSKIFR